MTVRMDFHERILCTSCARAIPEIWPIKTQRARARAHKIC